MPEDYNNRLRESIQKLKEIIKKITIENKNKSIESVPVKEQLNSTERPKAIGVFSFSYNNPTKIVKDGGDLA